MTTVDPERTAIKEWSVLCQAMGRGEILAMIRKGGIREQRSGFAVRHERFLLYPTFFHEKVRELAPRFAGTLSPPQADGARQDTIRIEHVADVASIWRVTDIDKLRGIDGEHGLAWSAVESRFHYRGDPFVQVVAVRVRRLRLAAQVPELRRYAGCVSWVELDEDVDVSGAEPVLPVEETGRRLARLHDALGTPDV